jgi:hypothetical protein
VAAYPSTVFRLDATGEVYEVVVEETDEALPVDKTQVTMSAGRAEEPFDEITWWSRQLGRPLDAA